MTMAVPFRRINAVPREREPPAALLGRADILHAEVRALFRGNPKSPDRTTTPLVVTSTRAAAKLNRTHVVRAAKTVIEPPKTDSASKAA